MQVAESHGKFHFRPPGGEQSEDSGTDTSQPAVSSPAATTTTVPAEEHKEDREMMAEPLEASNPKSPEPADIPAAAAAATSTAAEASPAEAAQVRITNCNFLKHEEICIF